MGTLRLRNFTYDVQGAPRKVQIMITSSFTRKWGTRATVPWCGSAAEPSNKRTLERNACMLGGLVLVAEGDVSVAAPRMTVVFGSRDPVMNAGIHSWDIYNHFRNHHPPIAACFTLCW